ncbi:type IV secretory system conjugative DNA transfer family protein [Thermomonospora umbrina]|uniref:TraM-binding TraD/TraG-like protein n=1 Tax=Thermomonospora umbrina TaxID=111806 RepID=A0A3D9T1D6_9ACTN|nr:TraM recognition domain-containing protein [Thermomonospora umbrina]REF00641.1 TraM-binding TraD/TraG-like protein [Thermomonospora umbrina]
MTRALGPKAGWSSGGNPGGWIVLGVCWAFPVLFVIVWAAAWLASLITTGTVEGFGFAFVHHVVVGRTRQAWPNTPTPLVVANTLALCAAAAVAALKAWRRIDARRGDPADPVAALADNPGLDVLKPDMASAQARELRVSLAKRSGPLPDHDIGLPLGDLKRPGGKTGPTLFASWEDSLVTFMAPRSGKTTCLSIPYVLSAPGPVIATSNKGDLWAATAQSRADDTGANIWLFDPQKITYQPQKWWWDPLLGLAGVEDAHRLAGHFVLTVDDGSKKDLWGPAAQDLLASLFLAASSSGRTLHDVALWLDEPAVPTPVELLQKAGFKLMASGLRGAQNGAVETRDGIYQTARTAAKALRDEDILAWVTPPEQPLRRFNPDVFVTTRDALFLLSKSKSPAAPLIAALTDANMRAAERRAERSGGRIDPPLVVVLDEAANICRIADLPELYSHLGSRGIIPVTILQSYEQGQTVWGEQGMAALWGAATRKIIGAGVDSPRLARDLSTLVGQHDVAVRSITHGQGQASEQISLRRQDILEAAAIRALPPGSALLLATGGKPALLQLRPWYRGPRAAEISAHMALAERMIADAANDTADRPRRGHP